MEVSRPLIQAFGEQVVRKIFSKTWQFRDEGLNDVEQMVMGREVSDEAKGFVNAIGAVRYTLGDKMAQVAQKSMTVLINLCKGSTPTINNSNLKGELYSYTEPILSILSDKIGDNLVKVRSLAEDSMIAMAEHPSFGLSPVLTTLFRSTQVSEKKENAKKNMQSNKHIVGRYQVLQRILQSYDVTDKEQVKGCV